MKNKVYEFLLFWMVLFTNKSSFLTWSFYLLIGLKHIKHTIPSVCKAEVFFSMFKMYTKTFICFSFVCIAKTCELCISLINRRLMFINKPLSNRMVLWSYHRVSNEILNKILDDYFHIWDVNFYQTLNPLWGLRIAQRPKS